MSDRLSERMPDRISECIRIYRNIYPIHILPDGPPETMPETCVRVITLKSLKKIIDLLLLLFLLITPLVAFRMSRPSHPPGAFFRSLKKRTWGSKVCSRRMCPFRGSSRPWRNWGALAGMKRGKNLRRSPSWTKNDPNSNFLSDHLVYDHRKPGNIHHSSFVDDCAETRELFLAIYYYLSHASIAKCLHLHVANQNMFLSPSDNFDMHIKANSHMKNRRV